MRSVALKFDTVKFKEMIGGVTQLFSQLLPLVLTVSIIGAFGNLMTNIISSMGYSYTSREVTPYRTPYLEFKEREITPELTEEEILEYLYYEGEEEDSRRRRRPRIGAGRTLYAELRDLDLVETFKKIARKYGFTPEEIEKGLHWACDWAWGVTEPRRPEIYEYARYMLFARAIPRIYDWFTRIAKAFGWYQVIKPKEVWKKILAELALTGLIPGKYLINWIVDDYLPPEVVPELVRRGILTKEDLEYIKPYLPKHILEEIEKIPVPAVAVTRR